MSLRRLHRLLALVVTMLAPSLAMAQAPQRVVTVNLCLDMMALRLAAPGQLVGVSWRSHQPHLSVMAAEARAVTAVRATVESILDVRPDLVIMGEGGHAVVKRLLRQAGVRVVEAPFATSLADVEPIVGIMATALGREEAGRRLVADMQEQRRLLAHRGPATSTAVVLQANRGTAGKGSLMNDILRTAGVRNLAAEWGLPAYGRLSLEAVVAAQPDLILLDGESNLDPSWATDFVDHRALRALAGRTRLVSVPLRYAVCGGPENFEVMRLLAGARA